VDDHLAILTAITAGRTSDATSLMKQHLQHIEDELDFSRQATPRLNLVEILQDP
jgi:DNA-binding GntR family transcriptional regulator